MFYILLLFIWSLPDLTSQAQFHEKNNKYNNYYIIVIILNNRIGTIRDQAVSIFS